MSSQKIKTQYISEIDQFLQEMADNQAKLSNSQQREITKHARIQRLRDTVNQIETVKKPWDDFL